MFKPKILLLTPSFKLKGGVTEFNRMLVKYSKSNLIVFEFLSSLKQTKIGKINFLIFDYFRFVFILLSMSIDIVHINPSLDKKSILRDGYYIRLAKFFRKKVFIHWHGWNPENEFLLHGKNLVFFKKTFFKADHIKFLSCQASNQFKKHGFQNKITFGNTFIDDELLLNKCTLLNDSKNIKLLFLSTISKNKGIYLALEAFKLSSQVCSNIEMHVAGIGPDFENAKKFVLENNITNVFFKGHVEGLDKTMIFSNSHIYLFPSFYEGMPTSLLEAMGFGLTIICSNVGAIPEIFVNEKMGKMLNTFNAKDYSESIIQLVKNKEERKRISDFNINYAREHFVASETIVKIDLDYRDLYFTK